MVSAVACGYTDGGSGTNTLEVVATLVYETRHSDEGMQADVSIRKNGLAVEGATVILTDGDKNDAVTVPQHDNGQNTRYRTDSTHLLLGYRRKLELRVESGSDRLEAKLEGPGPHLISKPTNDEQMSRGDLGDSFEVRWKTEDGIAADEVVITVTSQNTDDRVRTVSGDPGKYDMSSTTLENFDNNIRVLRRNRLRLSGGTGASEMTLGYEASNRVVVNP